MLNKISLLCFSLLFVLSTACIEYKKTTDESEVTSSSYGGLTVQATITQDNAQTLAIATVDGSTIGDNQEQLAVLFDNIFSNLQSQESGITAAAVASGLCGGSATYPDNIDQQQNPVTGTISFDNYCLDGGESGQVIVDGQISFIAQVQDSQLVSMAIELDNLVMTYDGNTMTINSTVALSGTTGNYDLQFETTTDFVGSDGQTLRVENLVISGDPINGVVISSGRIYQPDYGYVDISTTETVMFEGCDNGNPVSGTVLLEGSDNTNAEIVFTSCTTYEVCVDNNSICTPYTWE